MRFFTMILFLIFILTCSCTHQFATKDAAVKKEVFQLIAPKSGLKIENNINRGVGYTDPYGNNFNIRYIPITIRNDSIVPIHFQITFLKEYDYPKNLEEEQFKIIVMPEEWALDQVDITKKMFDELPKYIDHPSYAKTLQPGEQCILGIGTLYPNPAKICGILPNALFVIGEKELDQSCTNLIPSAESNISQLRLGLKLKHCVNGGSPGCTLLSCGQISYPEF